MPENYEFVIIYYSEFEMRLVNYAKIEANNRNEYEIISHE